MRKLLIVDTASPRRCVLDQSVCRLGARGDEPQDLAGDQSGSRHERDVPFAVEHGDAGVRQKLGKRLCVVVLDGGTLASDEDESRKLEQRKVTVVVFLVRTELACDRVRVRQPLLPRRRLEEVVEPLVGKPRELAKSQAHRGSALSAREQAFELAAQLGRSFFPAARLVQDELRDLP